MAAVRNSGERSSNSYLTDPLRDSHRHKLLQVTRAVVLTPLFFFCNMSEPVCENAVWNQQEINHMMNYLWDHASEAGDGGNFKDLQGEGQ